MQDTHDFSCVVLFSPPRLHPAFYFKHPCRIAHIKLIKSSSLSSSSMRTHHQDVEPDLDSTSAAAVGVEGGRPRNEILWDAYYEIPGKYHHVLSSSAMPITSSSTKIGAGGFHKPILFQGISANGGDKTGRSEACVIFSSLISCGDGPFSLSVTCEEPFFKDGGGGDGFFHHWRHREFKIMNPQSTASNIKMTSSANFY
jgi:hypothetical protein